MPAAAAASRRPRHRSPREVVPHRRPHLARSSPPAPPRALPRPPPSPGRSAARDGVRPLPRRHAPAPGDLARREARGLRRGEAQRPRPGKSWSEPSGAWAPTAPCLRQLTKDNSDTDPVFLARTASACSSPRRRRRRRPALDGSGEASTAAIRRSSPTGRRASAAPCGRPTASGSPRRAISSPPCALEGRGATGPRPMRYEPATSRCTSPTASTTATGRPGTTASARTSC